MTLDYDLVIIGSGSVGIYAAKSAVQLQARVALVTQSDELFLPDALLRHYSIAQVAQLNYRLANDPFATTSQVKFPYVSLFEAGDWGSEVDDLMQTKNSLSSLAALGVDVITGKGEFCSLPKLAFQIKNRNLRSRNFLLATGTNSQPRWSDNHLQPSYLTIKELYQRDLSDLGQNIIVVGSDPTALELAQTLARFAKQVTLVVEKSRILPHEDLDLVALMQAQLEAEGIKIYTNVVVSQIKTIEQQRWLQVGNRALVADEVILSGYRQPNIAGLNLAAVNVKYNQQRIYVNRKLQTTNPQIYACGDLIGGYNLPNITSYEINLILKNTLFFTCYKTNYLTLPWAILTQPNFARVGLNEQQAKQKYGLDIYIIREYVSDIATAQISEQTSGVCKLLVRNNGEILGCSLFCDRATELITIIALMMKHKIPLDQNPMRGLTSLTIPTIYPSMAEILQRASNSFYYSKLQRHPRLLNRLRSWFSLRKQWHR